MAVTLSLEDLHNAYMTGLDGEELMNYLLSCQDLLKEDDVTGWLKRFAPAQSIESKEQPPAKRRRMSPSACLYQPRPPCPNCNSNEVDDDIQQGHVVCYACGLVVERQFLATTTACMSSEQLKSSMRHKPHEYSKIVYFRQFLMGLQGKTTPHISGPELASLRLTTSGCSFVDADVVNAALKKLKLATKYRRHRYSLAVKLNSEYRPVSIEQSIFFRMLRLFRVIEFNWKFDVKKKMKGRRVFFSYPYVYYQICVHMRHFL
jgi:hypothetical protein